MSEAARGGDAKRAITQTASTSPLRLRRPEVRLSVGLLTGLLSGPLLGYVIRHLPGDPWLGPYIPCSTQMTYQMAFEDACLGLPIGLAIALGVLLLQRWWRGERGVVASPGPHWPGTSSEGPAPDRTGIRTSSDRAGIQGEDDR
jgi:hypothetical protein